MPTPSALARALDAIWQDANDAIDVATFRLRLVERMGALVGMDSGLMAPVEPGDDDASAVPSIGIPSEAIAHVLRNGHRYDAPMRPIAKVLMVHGAVDHEQVMGTSWKRVPIYDEVWAPLGIVSVVTGAVVFRGSLRGRLCFNRCHGSSAFRDRDLERLRRALPVACMADSAVTAWRAADQSAHPSIGALTPREREVASLIGIGMHNKEIAAALGTSVETVRKQTIAVYQKLGVTGRVGLLAWLARSKGSAGPSSD